MQRFLDYILKNKEWLFSGVGIFVISGISLLFRWMLSRRAPLADVEPRNNRESLGSDQTTEEDGDSVGVPREWQTIVPPQSKYKWVSERTSDIPLGLQSLSYEYGPEGHANPLILKDVTVRAEIHFTCRIDNPYRALYVANDYALNVLPPRLLTQARNILEAYSLAKLRDNRQEASRAIVNAMAPQFRELGVRLESVTIGALDQIEI